MLYHKHFIRICIIIILIFIVQMSNSYSAEVLSPADVLQTKSIGHVDIRPDGKWIAFTISTPRKADDKPGGAYRALYVISTRTGEKRPFITGKVSISSPTWSPDGKRIAFLMKRGDDAKTQVWCIPFDGGEAHQITHSKSGVSAFKWHPSGKSIAYIASTPPTKREEQLKEKGYDFVFYEENLKHRNLYIVNVDDPSYKADQLSSDMTIWDFVFSLDGMQVAASVSPLPLIDHRYMFRKIYLMDLKTRTWRPLTDNNGKLGNYAFSPDGKHLAYTAALKRSDHQVSQVYVIDLAGGAPKNLTPPEFKGHVNWVAWKNRNTILYYAGEGTTPTLSELKISNPPAKRKIVLHAADLDISFSPPSLTPDARTMALVGSGPEIPSDLYVCRLGQKPRRLTTINPWVAERTLGRQEVIRYPARDGWTIEGILIYPVGYQPGTTWPLIVQVHGGPEYHYSNQWVTRYSRPGQVLAGRGYAVFYPNYRASTGYGLEFANAGYGDAAGKEFDDIADGIDYLINQGIADKDRVGLGGGSYGGYAAAWFSSYYTKKVKAVCMFVGISDLISKRGTTDIPYEELYVHSGKKLEAMWEMSLQRSPIYWAHQSKTAVLIYGGTADTRVHPSQSLEYYRRLKMNNHPAVRLVQYPGEPHGNRKQPGQIDVLYRTLDWWDWYVKDAKPIDGPMPPLDISDKYGLQLED